MQYLYFFKFGFAACCHAFWWFFFFFFRLVYSYSHSSIVLQATPRFHSVHLLPKRRLRPALALALQQQQRRQLHPDSAVSLKYREHYSFAICLSHVPQYHLMVGYIFLLPVSYPVTCFLVVLFNLTYCFWNQNLLLPFLWHDLYVGSAALTAPAFGAAATTTAAAPATGFSFGSTNTGKVLCRGHAALFSHNSKIIIIIIIK